MQEPLSTEPEILRALGDASKAGRGTEGYRRAIQEIAMRLTSEGLQVIRRIYGDAVELWREALDVMDAYESK